MKKVEPPKDPTHRIQITYLKDPPPANVMVFDVDVKRGDSASKSLAIILREVATQLEEQ